MSRAVHPDFSEALSGISVPALLIWGADARSPSSAVKRCAIASTDPAFVVIPDAGHASNMEQPARLNAEVRTFLLQR